MKANLIDCVVIGYSLAGVSAALTLARGSRSVVVISLDSDTDAIEDLPHIQRTDLGAAMTGVEFQLRVRDMLEKAGVLLEWNCLGVPVTKDVDLQVLCADKRWLCRDVVFAPNGMEPGLDVDGIDRLFGFGVSYSAAADAAYFRSRPVAVFGDYPRVIQHAAIASRYAASVDVLMKGGEAHVESQEYRALQSAPSIRFAHSVEMLGFRASQRLLEAVEFRSGNARKTIDVAALFVAQHLVVATEFVSAPAARAIVCAGLSAGIDYWDHAALVNDGARAAQTLLAVHR